MHTIPKRAPHRNRWRLDQMNNVPLLYLPLVLVFWILWSGYLYVTHGILYFTCRKEIRGGEFLEQHKNFIYCGWHSSLVPYLSTCLRYSYPHVQLINSAWFMFPIHFLVRRMRMKVLVPASSGVLVKKATDEVVHYLKQGYSTLITPDGPSGPVHTLRRGVLFLAAESGVPILPLRSEAKHAWVWWWSWDKKRVPLPFSTITVHYQRPIFVKKDSIDEAEGLLRESLGD